VCGIGAGRYPDLDATAQDDRDRLSLDGLVRRNHDLEELP
jgi:hypothetical protein